MDNTDKPKVQFGFHIDHNRCIGCRTCQMACKDYKRTETGQNFRRVYEFEGGDYTLVDKEAQSYKCNGFSYHTSISCNHCADPACMPACPVRAISKSQTTGIVSIDQNLCIGCKVCAKACPYSAPQFSVSKRKMDKCNGCAEKLNQGMQPTCVESCPTRALHAGVIDNLRKAFNTTMASCAPLVSENLTKPSLCITPSKDTKPVDSKDGVNSFPLPNQKIADPF